MYSTSSFRVALTFSGFSICMGPVLWHLFSGMETAAFCAAVFWCGHFLNKQDYRFASWSAAVALLLRMEGILLLGLIAMALFRQFRKEGKGMDLRLWRDGLVRPLSALAVFMVLNVLHTGRVLPSTGDAKRFLFGVYYHGVDAIPEVPARLVDMAGAWWSLFEKGLGRNGVEWLYPLLGAMSLFGLLFLGLRRSRGLLFFLSWSLLLNLVYAVDLPILEVAGRYQATNLFLFSMGLAGCVCFLVRPELLGAKWVGRFLPWRQGMAVVGAMVALTIMACLSLSGTRWGQGRAVQIKHLEAVHQRAGLWLKDNNPECLPILLGEVGWVSFHTQDSEVCQPPLFDYYGVTDPAYFRAVQEGKAFTSALQNKREALFAFSLIGGGFHGIHLRMRWLDGPPGTWQPGAGYRAVEMNTGAQFRFEVYHRFGFEGLEERPFAHPVGESTAMNPMIVGRIRRTDVP